MGKVLIIPNADFSSVAFEKIEILNYTSIIAKAQPANGGIVTGGGDYAPGTSVTLEATAADHYNFIKWSDDVETPTRSITVGNYPMSYTAEFETTCVENAFTWGKGGISRIGTSSGNTNAVMSTITYLIHTLETTYFEAFEGYEIGGLGVLTTRKTNGTNYAEGEYTRFSTPIRNITIEAGKYLQFALLRADGNNADITKGAQALRYDGSIELA